MKIKEQFYNRYVTAHSKYIKKYFRHFSHSCAEQGDTPRSYGRM